MKHTQGPWEYHSGSVYCPNKGRLALMDRENPNTSPAERDGNAKLMATAPELLRDLVALADAVEGKPEEYKGNGKSVEVASMDRDRLRDALAQARTTIGKAVGV